MKDRSQESTEVLLAEFLRFSRDILKENSSRVIYIKCSSMRGIWLELEKRGIEPVWFAPDVLGACRARYERIKNATDQD